MVGDGKSRQERASSLLRDAKQVAHLPIEGLVGVEFSPDGKWLMTRNPPCRLWAVGTWHEDAAGRSQRSLFFPRWPPPGRPGCKKSPLPGRDRNGATVRGSKAPIWRCGGSRVQPRRVAPGGDHPRWPGRARLGPAGHPAAACQDGPRLGCAAFSEDDPASPTLPPLPPLKVDYGPSPLTGHLNPKIQEPLIADLETALTRRPDQRQIRGMLAQYCNNLAWGLVTPRNRLATPSATPRPPRLEVAPAQAVYLNTLGITQYRAGLNPAAVATLELSLDANHGEFAAFDLFPLAMAHYRLGHGERPATAFTAP